MRDASLPVTLIVVGIGWLLWELRLFPDLDWIISIGFVVAGIAVIVIDGVNKNSIVLGPFLVAAGIAWFVHDRYDWGYWRVIVPAMLVLLGILMLIARDPRVPERRIRAPGADTGGRGPG